MSDDNEEKRLIAAHQAGVARFEFLFGFVLRVEAFYPDLERDERKEAIIRDLRQVFNDVNGNRAGRPADPLITEGLRLKAKSARGMKSFLHILRRRVPGFDRMSPDEQQDAWERFKAVMRSRSRSKTAGSLEKNRPVFTSRPRRRRPRKKNPDAAEPL